MTLPNFLGIGAMRSGTSWLYQQLRSHREVFMPAQKEINFFTDFYDSGVEWYAGHFPSSEKTSSFKAIGEITPTYIADPEAPSRIHRHIPDCRLIVILRNPIERAYSEYTKALRNLNFRGTFDDLAKQNPGLLARGYYSRQLSRYFELFPRDQFLVLIFEKMISNHEATATQLARFLGIDPGGFDIGRMQQQVNASYLPRMPGLYSSAVTVRNYLVKNRMGWLPALAGQIGLIRAGRHLFRFRGPRSALPQLDETTRSRLQDLYATEILNLEKLLNEDLSIWKSKRTVR